MWHLVFCETRPCVSPCYEWRALLSVRPCPLWDLAFCETLASVKLCLLRGPSFCAAFCETLPLINGRYPVFCEALPFCETLPSLMCETLPSVLIHLKMFDWRDPALPCPLWDPAISSSFIWRCFDLQETGDHCCPDSPLRITCNGSAHRLCTNLSPWHCKLVLDTIQAHWLRNLSHSSRKLSNSQIVMFLCPLSCCHIFSLSSIIFPNFPCFLIFLKGFFSPHLGLTPQTFQWYIYIYVMYIKYDAYIYIFIHTHTHFI